jgi:hypothetical protein
MPDHVVSNEINSHNVDESSLPNAVRRQPAIHSGKTGTTQEYWKVSASAAKLLRYGSHNEDKSKLGRTFGLCWVCWVWTRVALTAILVLVDFFTEKRERLVDFCTFFRETVYSCTSINCYFVRSVQ